MIKISFLLYNFIIIYLKLFIIILTLLIRNGGSEVSRVEDYVKTHAANKQQNPA